MFFLALSACPAWAGEIQGRVMNPQGAAVPGAKVTVENESGLYREALAGSNGRYQIPGLESGIYTVTATGPSGSPSVRRDVIVATPDSSARMDFRLPQVTVEPVADGEEGNPNIFVYRMDLNALRKRLNTVRGPDPAYIREFRPERNYFGAEFGAPLKEFTPLGRRPLGARWNSTVTSLLQNSVLDARPFFNVGPLRSSRTNQYAVASGGPLAGERLSGLLRFARLRRSGSVNGNVQVPLPDERMPRSDDPRVNAVVAGLLGAYPDALPNLPQVSERQLNTNAPQVIDNDNALLRLDFAASDRTATAFRYSINDYRESPFELIVGRNPQTDLRNQGAHLSLTHNFSPSTVALAGFHFDRSKALLALTQGFTDLFEPLGGGAVPNVDFRGDTLQDLGPGPQFPRRRFQNQFLFYGDFSKTAGRHTLKTGWSTARVQVNDLQSDNSRGTLIFANDFGRTELENFLLGRPTLLTITLGNLYRGFRKWDHSFYFGDQIRVTPTLSLHFGVRYEMETAPTEVNGLTDAGYSTDANNFAPRFGFAWNPRRGGTTLRGAYGISYGSVFPVTYQFARFNPPAIQVVEIPAPDLASLTGFTSGLSQPSSGAERSALNRLSPDLVVPYSHQYSLAVERTLPGSFLIRAAYIGMRSFHLFTQNVTNRARPVPGIPLTTATVNQRRPDPRYFSITAIESNGIAYYDAAQLTVEKRLSHGLTFRSVYTFGKNIDAGADFTNTASGVESPPEVGNPSSELVSRVADLKSWSLFDTTHALSVSYTYTLPPSGAASGWKGMLLRGWEVSGNTVFQSGTPFHIHTGADGPGLGNVDGASQDRPNLLNASVLGRSIDNPDTSTSLLPREFFDSNLPPGGRGNIGFNVFRKDGANNWNVAIGKSFRFRGRRQAALRLQAAFLNLFNHAQFERPGVILTSPNFGQITNSVNKGRVTQLTVRVNF